MGWGPCVLLQEPRAHHLYAVVKRAAARHAPMRGDLVPDFRGHGGLCWGRMIGRQMPTSALGAGQPHPIAKLDILLLGACWRPR
eukprot:scaffold100305_cov32-Tisochrysis_lutea.AAC.2